MMRVRETLESSIPAEFTRTKLRVAASRFGFTEATSNAGRISWAKAIQRGAEEEATATPINAAAKRPPKRRLQPGLAALRVSSVLIRSPRREPPPRMPTASNSVRIRFLRVVDDEDSDRTSCGL